jgi:putative drug exporter of the RND superfamily
VFLAELAFAVAFGVLLDSLVVRSLLVPALTVDIGRRVWWPSGLRAERPGEIDGPSGLRAERPGLIDGPDRLRHGDS